MEEFEFVKDMKCGKCVKIGDKCMCKPFANGSVFDCNFFEADKEYNSDDFKGTTIASSIGKFFNTTIVDWFELFKEKLKSRVYSAEEYFGGSSFVSLDKVREEYKDLGGFPQRDWAMPVDVSPYIDYFHPIRGRKISKQEHKGYQSITRVFYPEKYDFKFSFDHNFCDKSQYQASSSKRWKCTIRPVDPDNSYRAEISFKEAANSKYTIERAVIIFDSKNNDESIELHLKLKQGEYDYRSDPDLVFIKGDRKIRLFTCNNLDIITKKLDVELWEDYRGVNLLKLIASGEKDADVNDAIYKKTGFICDIPSNTYLFETDGEKYVREYPDAPKASYKVYSFDKERISEIVNAVFESGALIDDYNTYLQEHAAKINDGDYRISNVALDEMINATVDYLEAGSSSSVCLPNLVLLGDAGTGKTELAKRYVENVLGGVIYTVTGSALKGMYLGHTRSKTLNAFRKLDEIAKEPGKGVDCPRVLFIDEAYVLLLSAMSQGGDRDIYSEEVIEVLLKATEDKEERILDLGKMNPDHPELNEQPLILGRNTAVWLGGYEGKMLKGLSANEGLARRFTNIKLPTPSLEDLMSYFDTCVGKCAEALADTNKKELGESIKDGFGEFDEWKSAVIKFFRWARMSAYSKYFGNYGGVKRLADRIKRRALLSSKDKWEKGDVIIITEIIDKFKKDIRDQYRGEIAENQKAPFEVQTDIEVDFSNYLGAESVKAKLGDIIKMIASPDAFEGCDIPKGALLVGPPGTGKTYLAKCMAGELNQRLQNDKNGSDEKSANKTVAFFSGSSTLLDYADEVKALFSQAGSYDFVIIFIDEIDAIGQKRGNYRKVLNELLTQMDGFDSPKNIFVLAATNDPGSLDEALVRPGRFDMTIEIGLPDPETRKALVSNCFRQSGVAPEGQHFEEIASALSGCSQVEIKAIMNQARVLYLNCRSKLTGDNCLEAVEPWFIHRVTKDDKAHAIEINGERILVEESKKGIDPDLFLLDVKETIAQRMIGERNHKSGTEKFDTVRNDGSKSSVAVHEVGHALVLLYHGHNIEKITVLSRGNVGGYVEPERTGVNLTREELLFCIDHLLGGRAAEELIYHKANISAGALNDIQKATALARNMVMKYGMSERIGPMALLAEAASYLHEESEVLCSPELRAEAEREIGNLLKERYSLTLEFLREHESELRKLAEKVYEKEEMSGTEFSAVLEEIRKDAEAAKTGSDR